MLNPLACPHCGHLDCVQKVSAVVDATSSSLHLAGPVSAGGMIYSPSGPGFALGSGWVGLTGRNEALLAHRLALPPPMYISPWQETPNFATVCFLGFMLVMGLGTISFLAAGGPSVFIGGGVLFAVLVLLLAMSKQRTASARRHWVAVAYPRWVCAMNNWEQLWFCHRCDGLFCPGQTMLFGTDQLAAFCYQ